VSYGHFTNIDALFFVRRFWLNELMGKTTKLGRAPIIEERVRSIGGQGFSFIPNRFLQDGFVGSLEPEELLLYFFLVLASDRSGMSFFHYDSICSLLGISVQGYIEARNGLIDKDLIAFDGTRFQVLSLPQQPVLNRRPLKTHKDFEQSDPATINQIIRSSMKLEQD
jgi:hypothetical protein